MQNTKPQRAASVRSTSVRRLTKGVDTLWVVREPEGHTCPPPPTPSPFPFPFLPTILLYICGTTTFLRFTTGAVSCLISRQFLCMSFCRVGTPVRDVATFRANHLRIKLLTSGISFKLRHMHILALLLVQKSCAGSLDVRRQSYASPLRCLRLSSPKARHHHSWRFIITITQ